MDCTGGQGASAATFTISNTQNSSSVVVLTCGTDRCNTDDYQRCMPASIQRGETVQISVLPGQTYLSFLYRGTPSHTEQECWPIVANEYPTTLELPYIGKDPCHVVPTSPPTPGPGPAPGHFAMDCTGGRGHAAARISIHNTMERASATVLTCSSAACDTASYQKCEPASIPRNSTADVALLAHQQYLAFSYHGTPNPGEQECWPLYKSEFPPTTALPFPAGVDPCQLPPTGPPTITRAPATRSPAVTPQPAATPPPAATAWAVLIIAIPLCVAVCICCIGLIGGAKLIQRSEQQTQERARARRNGGDATLEERASAAPLRRPLLDGETTLASTALDDPLSASAVSAEWDDRI